MKTGFIRIDEDSNDILEKLSDLKGESKEKIVYKALLYYSRKCFLKKCAVGYEKLYADPKRSNLEKIEVEEWDRVSV